MWITIWFQQGIQIRWTHCCRHVLLVFLEFYQYDVYALCHVSRWIPCSVCTLNAIAPVCFSGEHFLFPCLFTSIQMLNTHRQGTRLPTWLLFSVIWNSSFTSIVHFLCMLLGRFPKIRSSVFGELLGRWILIFKGNEDLRLSLK